METTLNSQTDHPLETVHRAEAPTNRTADIITSVVTSTLHPTEAVIRCLSIDFDFDGCVFCDDESLHADLAALFERGG